MGRTMLGPAVLAVLLLLGCADTPGGPAAGDPGARPATADDLLGRWYPADGAAQGRAFAEFAAGGSWRGSDGCNGQSGTWSLGPDATFTGTANPSTLIACENVPIARWIATAQRTEIDGADLVLHGSAGTARLVRELP